MPRDERSQFLASLKKDAAALAAAAKKEQGGGYVTDEDVLEALGVDSADTKVRVTTRLSRIRYGIDKNKNKYFSFRFIIDSGENKGLPVDVFIGLDPSRENSYEISCNRLMGYLQSLGYDTLSWSKAQLLTKLVDAADELTASKPYVVGMVGAYERQDGSLGLNFNIVSSSPADSSPEAPETPEADTDDDEEEEAPPTPAKAKKPARAAKAKKPSKPAPPPEEEEYEDVDDEDEETSDDTDWSEWVGYTATFDNGEGPQEVTLTEWNEDEGVFTVEDAEEMLYEVAPEDLDFPEEE